MLITIADQWQRPFPTLALAATLARLGVKCHVQESGQAEIHLRPDHRPEPYQMDTDYEHPQRQNSLCLSVSHTPVSFGNANTDTLLITAPASSTGIRDSFARLKHYLSVMQPARVGVTLLDCHDRYHAGRCFTILDQACRRFLTTGISSYGAISSTQEWDRINEELTGIARLLISDHGLSATQTPKHPASVVGGVREETA
jgi:hypothetical protein